MVHPEDAPEAHAAAACYHVPEAHGAASYDALGAYVSAFVDELVRAGLRHVVICPGSRSTPLAITLEEHPGIRVWMHLDERSASYFALGMAKARREPVAVLCTSGTAAANFLPAVVESRYSRVPLLVLTADRPPELREVGAPQTIDQLHLYGHHVKWFADMALPEGTESALRYVRVAADRALSTARATPAGPVHLNFLFREPLLPANAPPSHRIGQARVLVQDAPRIAEPALVRALADELRHTERGLIVCGPQDDDALRDAAQELSQRLSYPILADPLSQVRCGSATDRVIATYDAFLRDSSCAGSLDPEVVLRVGAVPTSKPLTQYLQRHGARHILVDPAGWNDPLSAATDLIHTEPAPFLRSLAQASGERATSPWLGAWQRAERSTGACIASYLDELQEPFEGKVFARLAELLPAGSVLFAGSSMPVRDMDTFFPAGERPVRFMANRGANGIDGVVSSALGASASARPLVLVIGDLSFYHDMNGLLAAKLHHLDATIILLNNDGGGIFSFLPQAGVPAFEMLFGTPHGLDFAPAVEMYGGSFARVTGWNELDTAVHRAIGSPGLSVVEMPTERGRNVALHRALWGRISSALKSTVGAGV